MGFLQFIFIISDDSSPKRVSLNVTASGSTKSSSVPDFSSLLIFNWKKQIPKTVFLFFNHKINAF